jgi:hypothetical protein
MKKQPRNQKQTTPLTRTLPHEEANRQRQKAETEEVAGRHKNDGQKDHKGAR